MQMIEMFLFDRTHSDRASKSVQGMLRQKKAVGALTAYGMLSVLIESGIVCIRDCKCLRGT
jgi:hypothetical protein